MATKNLNLPQFDGSDYISVDPFNDAFSKLDKLGTDYVVESGKVGEWWYRKWKSGRAECGIDAKEFPRQNMQPFGSSKELHMTPPTSVGAFPIQFKSIPTVLVNYLNDKAYKGRGCFVINYGNTTTTTGPTVAMVDPTNAPAQLVFSIFVAGWYK